MTFEKLQDFVGLSRVTSLVTSPTADRTIATVATLSTKKDSYLSHLVELGDTPRRLTRSSQGESLTAIGNRGEIYFSSPRRDDGADDDSMTALWMLPSHGEARVVLRRPGGISSLTVSGNKAYIVAPVLPDVADEEAYAETMKNRKEAAVSGMLHTSFPTRYWDHDLGPTISALYVADLPELDSDDMMTLHRLSLPEGRLGTVIAEHGEVIISMGTRVKTSTHTTVYRLVDGEFVEIASHDPEGPEDCHPSCVSPDGSKLVFHVSWGNVQGKPLRNWAEILDLETGKRTRLAPKLDDWPGEIAWVDDTTLVVGADRKGRHSLYRVSTNGQHKLLTDDNHAYTNIGIRGREIWCLRSAIDQPGTPVSVNVDTAEVTEQGVIADRVTTPGTLDEVFTTAEDGTEIRAWLAHPGGQAPLLVFVHGGPWGSWNDWTWRWNPWPFVAQGYAVLMPDPAISTGYGQHMIDRGNDQLGGTPFTDLLALIDATEARDDIDASKTAVLGGSYGGYMANWFAGHTGDRFSCIVTHASLWNIDIMGRTTDNGIWHEWMSTEQASTYSPHDHAAKIEVPMLVIHGDKDYRVPISQGHALWHALLRESAVDGHQFLYYPDENHWILKPSNSALWYDTVMAFVDHHVKGKEWQKPSILG